jgi:hypothetical protein
MARGKAAARSANRRATAVGERVAELESELKEAQRAHRAQVQQLRTELTQARSEVTRQAEVLAQAELARVRGEVDAANDQCRVGEKLLWNTTLKQDRLIRNACRYLSMKSGRHPLDVLPLVITWLTDEDFYIEDYGDPAALLVKLGVDRSGWVAHILLRRVDTVLTKYDTKSRELASRERVPTAWSLDHVEDHPEDFSIHEKYKPKWYPRLKYGGVSVYQDGTGDEEPQAESA